MLIPPLPQSYSAASPRKQGYAHLPPDEPDEVMPLWATPFDLTIFEGEKQPPPKERLEQIQIFLADEDYHRNLNFKDKLDDIERYVDFLQRNHYKPDDDKESRLLKNVKEMIYVHKTWIRKATGVPYLSLKTGRFSHQNRLVHMIKNLEKQKEIINTRAPRISQELPLISGPALHIVINDKDRKPSPDPFLYTKQVAEIRRRQDNMAEKLRAESPAANFNGPFTSLLSEQRTGAMGDQIQKRKEMSTMRDFKEQVDVAVGSTIIDIAQPLDPEVDLTEIQAARLLQKQILIEHNHNWETRTLENSKLWRFADNIERRKTFFSFDRWPVELQSPEQRDKIKQGAPKPYPSAKMKLGYRKFLKSKRASPLDPNERYIPGDTLFPFGETQIQVERKSQMINRMLAGGEQINPAHLRTIQHLTTYLVPKLAHANDKGGQRKEDVTIPAAPLDLLALPELSDELQENAEAGQKSSGEASDTEDTNSEDSHPVESSQPSVKRRRVI